MRSHEIPSTRPVPVTTGAPATQCVVLRCARVAVVEFPRALRLASHIHERACVTVVLEGRFIERFQWREHDCAPGTLLAKPPVERHSDRFSLQGSRQVIVEPDPACDGMLSPVANLFESIRTLRSPSIDGLGRRIAREVEQPDGVTTLALEALVLELLVTGARVEASPSHGAEAPAWLRRARDLLHDSLHALPGVRELAGQVGVHPAHLTRTFSAHFGMPIGEYARRLRIEAAADALVRTQLPLAHISVRAGFSDQSHFTRTFKRYTGQTPLQYRRGNRRSAS